MTFDDSALRTPFETAGSHERTNIRDMVLDTYGNAARMREPARILARNYTVGHSTDPIDTACRNTSGLGCGEPTALAALQPGETVLDLGSGPGFDCLVAALCVGSRGRVVGIDVTPEMVRLACRNATDAGLRTVSFLLGEIERLPLRENVFDVAISNCVINLCPDKTRVLSEVHRVLRHGGRLAVADIVALAPLPREIADDLAFYAGCVAGAVTVDELSVALHKAGFKSVRIVIRDESEKLISSWATGHGLERFVAAVNVTATKC